MSPPTGTSGDDTLNGTASSGNNTMDSGADGDSIVGGFGRDSIRGGTGDDTIRGNSELNTIDGSAGDHLARGGQGDGTFLFKDSFGNDTITGSDDNDTITLSEIEALTLTEQSDFVDAALDHDGIFGDEQGLFINARDGDDTIICGRGANTIDGGKGNDEIDGGYGDDEVSGGSGNDVVIGDDGRDTVYGGSGNDILSGHEGDDSYFLDPAAGGGADFTAESDTDVVHFGAGGGHDVAYGFEDETDHIYTGAVADDDITAARVDNDTWVQTFDGNSAAALTLNFTPSTAPDAEGDPRNQFVDDTEYSPPENGDKPALNPACYSPQNMILTDSGLRRIGSLRSRDLLVPAHDGLAHPRRGRDQPQPRHFDRQRPFATDRDQRQCLWRGIAVAQNAGVAATQHCGRWGGMP